MIELLQGQEKNDKKKRKQFIPFLFLEQYEIENQSFA